MRIEDYAEMAKISLSESEKAEVSTRVKKLVNSFSALDNINTEGVAIQFTVLPVKNVFREDTAVKSVSRETLLSNAPEQYDGYFQVPKTID
ncbi:MAG: Asp-tRNA(Asn)/Glu-tRNA(Gln) amidotransferase subunit GatC [Thermoclostridium sp.]|nr:Asp-tRNA(Asn)/Glu-tRNA(Gln) amidotransferase subunit GatC [Thermoclostridium sp.]